ncbi:competence type IV pilus minor pilin ComGF [Enterococcus sp. 22-H-5-01]|uniref:competence type IV pilus minor pilin ComGF n=1 Tax=Enterococcus sp. 22-H-5-01 TaxID=3418555 RepID=UPI003D051939
MSKTRGFTLLESLVALLMLSGILLLLSGVIRHVDKVEQALSGYHQLEWEVFLLQLDNELMDFDYEATTQHEIIGKKLIEDETAPLSIQRSKQKIIKRQSNGYQPLLTNVKRFDCQEKNQGVEFIVTFTDEKQKTGTWIYE